MCPGSHFRLLQMICVNIIAPRTNGIEENGRPGK